MRIRVWCVSLALVAASGAGFSQPDICKSNGIQPGDRPSVVVPVNADGSLGRRFYCNEDGTNAALPAPFKNKTAVDVVVTGINRLTQTCSITFQDAPVPEASLSGFASLFGANSANKASSNTGPSAAASTVKPPTPPAPKAGAGRRGQGEGVNFAPPSVDPVAQCLDAFKSAADDTVALQQAVDIFNGLVSAKVDAASGTIRQFNNRLPEIAAEEPSGLSAIQTALSSLPELTAPVLAGGELPPGAPPILTGLVGKDYASVAADLVALAVKDYAAIQPGQECKSNPQVVADLRVDAPFLESVFTGTQNMTSYQDKWKEQLDDVSQMAASLSTAKSQLADLLANPGPAVVRQEVPDINQTTDKVTVSCTTNPLKLPVINIVDQSQPSNKQGSTQPAGNTGSQPAATTQTYPFTLYFGYGPRFFQSGGVVFSPLKQHSFTTAAVSSSPSCPAMMPDGKTTAVGCIVDQGDTNWRILPAYVGSFRIRELPSRGFEFMPYLSIGATIKSSSSSGTSLEYLPGLSWAAAHRRLFLTAGGYAGQVTHLGGGLVTGAQSIAPPTTLPTSSGYKWGLGFAVTFNFNQKSAGSSTDPNQTTTGNSSPTTTKTANKSGKKAGGNTQPAS